MRVSCKPRHSADHDGFTQRGSLEKRRMIPVSHASLWNVCLIQVVKAQSDKKKDKKSKIKVGGAAPRGRSRRMMNSGFPHPRECRPGHLTHRRFFFFSSQAFVKTVNYNHLMPTRYTLDLDLKVCSACHGRIGNCRARQFPISVGSPRSPAARARLLNLCAELHRSGCPRERDQEEGGSHGGEEDARGALQDGEEQVGLGPRPGRLSTIRLIT